ncbi:MAG: acyltransferase [Alphaproteobacteria bacterium]|nr:MAG: acyltransferase [Alphaproteobacteria bacterium]
MTRFFSLYLDLLRFLAALLVLFSHFAYPRFTDGDYLFIRDLNLGSDAVVFFFVLSGLVISYTAEVKDKTLRQYAFSRATRLYSVVIPALLLTVLMDGVGSRIAPAVYDGWWYNAAPVWEQLLRGWTFSNEWGLLGFRIGTNGPYWSLSYEAAYYLIFGAAFYLRGGWRAGLLVLFCFFAGISVLLLLPVWLLGIAVYKVIKQDVALTVPQAWGMAVVPVLFYAGCLWAGLPHILLAGTEAVFGQAVVKVLFGFSDEFLWNTLIGALVALHLIGVAALAQHKDFNLGTRAAAAVRWCAGATFTIYIIHYPALQFFDALLPDGMEKYVRQGVLLFAVLLLCFATAEISERRLGWFRRKLSFRKS